jgi:hypothetical protein
MAMIRKKRENKERVIDLTGPDGNAFVLIGYAKSFARQLESIWEEEMKENRIQNRTLLELGLADEKAFPESFAEQVVAEMTSGDYENLVQVFDRYFGSFVILER